MLLCFLLISLCPLVSPWEHSEVCAHLILMFKSGPGASVAMLKYSLPRILDMMPWGERWVIWGVSSNSHKWHWYWVHRKRSVSLPTGERVDLPPSRVPLDVLCSRSIRVSWLALGRRYLSDAQFGSTSFPQGYLNFNDFRWNLPSDPDILLSISESLCGDVFVLGFPGDVYQDVLGCGSGMSCLIFCSHLLLWTSML